MTKEQRVLYADIRETFPDGEMLNVSQVAQYTGKSRETAARLMGGRFITRIALAMRLAPEKEDEND